MAIHYIPYSIYHTPYNILGRLAEPKPARAVLRLDRAGRLDLLRENGNHAGRNHVEGFTRLAETRLAQNTFNYIKLV